MSRHRKTRDQRKSEREPREAFVWENPDLLASLQRGIEQAAVGQVEDRGSFAAYAEEDAS